MPTEIDCRNCLVLIKYNEDLIRQGRILLYKAQFD